MIEVIKSISTVVVQLLSCVLLCVAPWAAARQASLSSTISWSLLKFMSIESVMLSNHIFLCFLTHIKVSQETHKVVWDSHHFKNFLEFVVIHTDKGFLIVKQQK